jgi:alkaline phosphatase D
MAIQIGSSATRRRFMATSAAATTLAAIGSIARPFISRANDRPLITHGLQSGDVSADSGVIWARADRPSRMLVEIDTTDSFTNIRNVAFVDALPETDFTAKLLLENLPPAQDIFYRVRFQDLASPTISGEPKVGRLRTAPNDRRSISFVWSGDTAGQGWGIDESRGGMRTYASMLKNRPDSQWRHHLRRRTDRSRTENAERPSVAKCRNRGQIKTGGDADRVPRQL